MNRLNSITARSGIMILALLLTFLLASCSSDDPAAPAITNQEPAVPVIAAGSGTPADGAVDVALAVVLNWSCSDPDDDPLTYTVRFGTAAAPPVVAEDLAALSYTPTGLLNGTTYYWQIVASDDASKSTGSPVWSFTTVAAGVETVTRPDTPAGETTVEIGVTSSYDSGGSYSTLSHGVEYRFDWGDGTMSDWAGASVVGHAWTTAGTYEVAAQARCQDHPEVESVWSLVLTVTVLAAETVSTPDPPAGATTTEIQVSQSYDLGGAVNSWGHAVEYRVDWDDGQVSGWTAGTSYSHTWTTAGSYDVLVQARCQDHPALESAWSAPTTVTVTEPGETITPPAVWNPPASGGVNDEVEFRGYGGASNLYHQLECRFDWGDGTFSDWTGSAGGYYYGTHAWSAVGTYEIRVQARCIEHPDAVSDWSAAATFEVTDTETVSAPYFNFAGERTFDLGDWIFPILSGSESNMGHAVEYQFDLGDGTFSEWANSAPSIHFETLGDFEIRGRARCRDHTDVVSDWSESLFAHVVELEDVSTPVASGPTTGNVGVPITVTVTGAESSMGHDLEYQLYWSYDYGQIGTGLGWTTSDNLTYTADSQGLRHLRVRARCIEHQIESNISNRLDINIAP